MTTDPNCKRCKFYYSYKEKDDGSVEIWAEEDKVCIPEYSLLIILWAVLIALLIGLLFLCCWRICVFCVDREKKYATVAYLVEFIKAKHHFKRSQSHGYTFSSLNVVGRIEKLESLKFESLSRTWKVKLKLERIIEVGKLKFTIWIF